MWRNIIIKSIVIITLVFWTRTIYSNPSGINVNWFVWSVRKIRSFLNILKTEVPMAYELVKNNISELNIDYIESPLSKWGQCI